MYVRISDDDTRSLLGITLSVGGGSAGPSVCVVDLSLAMRFSRAVDGVADRSARDGAAETKVYAPYYSAHHRSLSGPRFGAMMGGMITRMTFVCRELLSVASIG